MGGSTSKEEEVIITQAGNSGGISANANQNQATGYNLYEIVGIILICVIIGIIVMCIWKKIQKALEKKIRREIAKSRESVV